MSHKSVCEALLLSPKHPFGTNRDVPNVEGRVRHGLLRVDEHTVLLNAVSFRSINLVHSAQNNTQRIIFVVVLGCENRPER